MSALLRIAALVLLVALNGAAETARAKEAVPAAADPATEAKVARLANELRCLVCQNQTIADSNADLAVDLRQQIREQLRSGRTEAQVIDYMVQRYGDFVLYRPPFKLTTVLLWVGPFLLLVAAGVILYRQLARRRSEGDAAGLSEEEQARVRRLLASGKDRR